LGSGFGLAISARALPVDHTGVGVLYDGRGQRPARVGVRVRARVRVRVRVGVGVGVGVRVRVREVRDRGPRPNLSSSSVQGVLALIESLTLG
tara:strand:- start:221 stop:496 length:276 start_codon:yes stop_codon:yes gene_type:complete